MKIESSWKKARVLWFPQTRTSLLANFINFQACLVAWLVRQIKTGGFALVEDRPVCFAESCLLISLLLLFVAYVPAKSIKLAMNPIGPLKKENYKSQRLVTHTEDCENKLRNCWTIPLEGRHSSNSALFNNKYLRPFFGLCAIQTAIGQGLESFHNTLGITHDIPSRETH